MTDEQYAQLIERLDKIVALLELLAFPPDDDVCTHENAIDAGTMGMRPGERMVCRDCGETFSRVEG